MTIATVDVPEPFADIFRRAEEYARQYFGTLKQSPECGTIEISGERYILIRAATMSVEFTDLLIGIYREGSESEGRQLAANLLFDLGHAFGKSDARHFHSYMGITDPVERLSIGPVQFAFSGWASVKIDPSSRVMANENYYLLYDHPFSFEADSWIRRQRQATEPVCAMNAGYSSGWCEESFGVPLSAVEISCRAAGQPACRFIMAPPWRIEEHVAHYRKQVTAADVSVPAARIPEFFQRKRLEDKLRRNQRYIELLLNQSASKDLLLTQKDEQIAALKAQLAAAQPSAPTKPG